MSHQIARAPLEYINLFFTHEKSDLLMKNDVQNFSIENIARLEKIVRYFWPCISHSATKFRVPKFLNYCNPRPSLLYFMISYFSDFSKKRQFYQKR